MAEDQVVSAQILADLHKKTLEAERRAFERGRSSVEILIRFAEVERAARRELLRSRTGRILARLGLALALGLPPEAGKP